MMAEQELHLECLKIAAALATDGEPPELVLSAADKFFTAVADAMKAA